MILCVFFICYSNILLFYFFFLKPNCGTRNENKIKYRLMLAYLLDSMLVEKNSCSILLLLFFRFNAVGWPFSRNYFINAKALRCEIVNIVLRANAPLRLKGWFKWKWKCFCCCCCCCSCSCFYNKYVMPSNNDDVDTIFNFNCSIALYKLSILNEIVCCIRIQQLQGKKKTQRIIMDFPFGPIDKCR